MILTVFRPKRIKNGKARVARSYRGRYRLDEEDKLTIFLCTPRISGWPASVWNGSCEKSNSSL